MLGHDRTTLLHCNDKESPSIPKEGKTVAKVKNAVPMISLMAAFIFFFCFGLCRICESGGDKRSLAGRRLCDDTVKKSKIFQ